MSIRPGELDGVSTDRIYVSRANISRHVFAFQRSLPSVFIDAIRARAVKPEFEVWDGK